MDLAFSREVNRQGQRKQTFFIVFYMYHLVKQLTTSISFNKNVRVTVILPVATFLDFRKNKFLNIKDSRNCAWNSKIEEALFYVGYM